MRTKSFFLLVCVVVLALPLALVSAQGGVIGVNESVEGSLDASQAEYSLSLESGQSVSMMLVSDDFDAYLQVLDSSGMTLAEDDDSGGNLNSALLFTAPVAGTYTVVVGSFGGMATTGAYTLTTAESAVVELAYDSSAKVLFDGTAGVLYYTFTGKEGDVVNLYTDNPDLDLRLRLYDPDGSEIAYDDDSGDGYAPLLRRVLLPAAGVYRVELAAFSADETGVAQLILEQSELLMLDAGSQSVELNDELSTETFGMTVAEGMTYRVTVASDAPANGNVEITLDPTFYDVVSLSFNNTLETSAVFSSSISGTVTVELMNYTWTSEGVLFTVSVAPVE